MWMIRNIQIEFQNVCYFSMCEERVHVSNESANVSQKDILAN